MQEMYLVILTAKSQSRSACLIFSLFPWILEKQRYSHIIKGLFYLYAAEGAMVSFCSVATISSKPKEGLELEQK